VPIAEFVSGSQRQQGLRVAYRWSSGAGRVVDRAPREPVKWPSPAARRADSDTRIDLDTAVEPVRAEFRSYRAVDARTGVPTDTGIVRLCDTPAINAVACRTQLDGQTIRVDLPIGLGPYVVLYAEWYVPKNMRIDPSISSYSASWAFHLR
jgi:hypothetical protein